VTGTLAFVFIGLAALCIVAGVAAVTHTRRRVREADEEYGDEGGEATYAEEAAAVAAAEEAAAAAQDDEIGGAPTA
jgi:hypothetical protein